jgi:hypothetical protein
MDWNPGKRKGELMKRHHIKTIAFVLVSALMPIFLTGCTSIASSFVVDEMGYSEMTMAQLRNYLRKMKTRETIRVVSDLKILRDSFSKEGGLLIHNTGRLRSNWEALGVYA